MKSFADLVALRKAGCLGLGGRVGGNGKGKWEGRGRWEGEEKVGERERCTKIAQGSV